MPNIGEFGTRPYQDGELIGRDPDYGRIVCFCERVTRGEIDAALDSPIPPADADGLRRRTRALMGRCQGFFCGAEIAAALEADGWAIEDGPVDRRRRAVRAGGRDRAARAGHRAGDGDRARATRPADPAPLRPHRLRAARPAHRPLAGRATPSAIASWPTDAGVEVLAETMVTDWEGRPPEADRAGRPAGGRAAGGGAGDRVQGAPSLGAAHTGVAPGRRDDHLDPAAARPPARPEGRAAGGDRRRRARQLLGGGDPRPRGSVGGRTGDRAPQASVAGRVPGGRGGSLPGARLVAHGRQRDPRRTSGWSRWS